MMGFYHVYATNEKDGLFECCFDWEENYPPFFVRVDYPNRGEDSSTYFRAMQIADRELDMWNIGYEKLEDKDEYDYYRCACYSEVVMNALEKAGIEYEIYFKYEREGA